jgi:hypothetical protein
MMRPLFSLLFTVSLVLSLLQPSLARPVAHSSAHFQRLKEAVLPPANWIDLGPAPPTELIWLRIALPQARFPELERQLYEISDPKNARYGKHLLKEQVTELVRPERYSMEAVDTWLDEYGIVGADRVRRSAAGDWVTILVPVATADEMMDTVSNLLAFFPLPSSSPFHSDVLSMAICGVFCILGCVPHIVGVPPLEEYPRRRGRRRDHPHDALQPSRTPPPTHRTCAAYNVLWPSQADEHNLIYPGHQHFDKHIPLPSHSSPG